MFDFPPHALQPPDPLEFIIPLIICIQTQKFLLGHIAPVGSG